MELRIDAAAGFIYLYDRHGVSGKSAIIYFGEYEVCKTKAEAREAAEILKRYFIAKQTGRYVKLTIRSTPFYPEVDSVPDPMPDPILIAQLAAEIFAHNPHDFDERRAVQSAAKIIELSRNEK